MLKRLLFIAILLFVTQQCGATPTSVVDDFYRSFPHALSTGLPNNEELRALQKYFTKGLRHDLAKASAEELRCAEKYGAYNKTLKATDSSTPLAILKPPLLELSLYTLSTDGAHRFQIKHSEQNKQYAVVHVDVIYDEKNNGHEYRSPINVHLIKQKNGWRIFDFRASDHKESGRYPSLREMLRNYVVEVASCSPN